MGAVNMINILLVEDNEADVRLTQEAFKDCKMKNSMQVARDGMEAMHILMKEGKYANTPVPDIVILDLNLPKKDGRDILKEIKQDPKLKRIPVVVLTSSKAEEDIIKSYELHANCYIAKPIDLLQFDKIVRAIDDFWFSIVRLPKQTE